MAPTFAELNLSSDVVRALEAMRITEPTPIQIAVIPDALAGRDVLGKAPTGSGKTFGFGLPLLELVERAEPRRPRGLVLAPTRELAEQIRRELLPIAVAVERSVAAIYGGMGMGKQVAALRKGVDVVIATPGRLIDLLSQGEISLDMADRVVIDEADRMADMGFLPDVRHILDLTSVKRQTVLFSATLDNAVAILTDQYQTDPVSHSHGGDEPDITQMSHRFVEVTPADKVALAADIINAHGSTLVFCRTRHGVDRVCRQLKRKGINAGWIHGGRSQSQRDAALMAFTAGRVRALIATDVAARGIHVDDVACVLHYDLPADAKDYVHRSGRTARAGSSGDVISFVRPEQERAALALQRKIGLNVKIEQHSGPTDRADAKPARPARRPERAGSSSEGSDSKKEPVSASPKPTRQRRAAKKSATSNGSKSGAKPKSRRSGKPRPKSKNKKTQFRNRGKGRHG